MDATSPLTKLHTKFWDKSIDEDRSKWENEQRGVGVPMEAEGSDVGPGCFILDINIDSALSGLWVRQDYIRLYDGCNTYFNEISNLDVPPPCRDYRAAWHRYVLLPIGSSFSNTLL